MVIMTIAIRQATATASVVTTTPTMPSVVVPGPTCDTGLCIQLNIKGTVFSSCELQWTIRCGLATDRCLEEVACLGSHLLLWIHDRLAYHHAYKCHRCHSRCHKCEKCRSVIIPVVYYRHMRITPTSMSCIQHVNNNNISSHLSLSSYRSGSRSLSRRLSSYTQTHRDKIRTSSHHQCIQVMRVMKAGGVTRHVGDSGAFTPH